MSWIFGFYSKLPSNTNDFTKFHPEPTSHLSTKKYYISIGGNTNTLIYNNNSDNTKFFVCGFPISGDIAKFLGEKDFKHILTDSNDELKRLNGHFCGVTINNETLSFFTDQLGLREFHIYENNEGWYFSTRLDWILKLNHFEIDLNQFGSRWLLINQISNKSIVKNILRLNCGKSAVIYNNQIEIKENNWLPQKNKTVTANEFTSKLEKITLLGRNNNSKISLSLSGGMDSRVILSLLMNSSYKNWDCHTFQNSGSTDSYIAEKIVNDFKIKHKVYAGNLNSKENIIPDLFDYVGATYLTESVFVSRNLTHYKSLPKDDLIIDGGFGEIWRREFLTRLYHFARKDLLNKNYNNILKYLLNYRANIFTEEINSQMRYGIVEQLEELFDSLPPVEEYGLSNWLDLFSLKTRLVNYYAPEQSRIDNHVTSYMPYVQLSLLNDLSNLPVGLRENNRLFKKIIKSKYRSLSKYDLAKGNMTYPFYYTPIMKRIHSRVYNVFKTNSKNDLNDFPHRIKDFVMDSLLSNSARTYALYDYKLIYKNVNSYYNGDFNHRRFVDWFATFEIFRQIME